MRALRAFCLILTLFIAGTVAATSPSYASVDIGISVGFAPPPLPIYAQPPLPGPGYIWTPGYWAWGPYGYYWVPGTWVLPPIVGVLWTPPWWARVNGVYVFHAGYWGPHVGFYGGINYGFGYFGVGYDGGYWHGGQFFYNRAVNNIRNASVANTYERTAATLGPASRVSFDGGPGGLAAHPTNREQVAMQEHHLEATQLERQHANSARSSRALSFAANHGRPPITATPRAGLLHTEGNVTTHRTMGMPPRSGPLHTAHHYVGGGYAPRYAQRPGPAQYSQHRLPARAWRAEPMHAGPTHLGSLSRPEPMHFSRMAPRAEGQRSHRG